MRTMQRLTIQNQPRRAASTFLFLAFLAMSAFGQAQVNAQASPAAQKTAPRELPGGLSIGVTASILPFNVLASETIQTTTSNPVSRTVVATDSTSGPAGGGISFEIPIRGRFTFLSGVLYRGASYTAGSETVLGEDDEDTEDVDERLYSSTLERTRASYWDIPILMRVYDSSDRTKSFRPFLLAGGMVRIASGIDTYREIASEDGTITTSETPVEPANRRIFGATIGTGFRARAAGRVTLVPELRFTRWFSPTFLDEPTRSSKNQLEVTFSIMF